MEIISFNNICIKISFIQISIYNKEQRTILPHKLYINFSGQIIQYKSKKLATTGISCRRSNSETNKTKVSLQRKIRHATRAYNNSIKKVNLFEVSILHIMGMPSQRMERHIHGVNSTYKSIFVSEFRCYRRPFCVWVSEC